MGLRWSSPAAQAASITKSLEKLGEEITILRIAQENGNFSKSQQKKLCDLIIEHNDLVKGFKLYLVKFRQILPEDDANEYLAELHEKFNCADKALSELLEDDCGVMATKVADSFKAGDKLASCFSEVAKIAAAKNAKRAQQHSLQQQYLDSPFNQRNAEVKPYDEENCKGNRSAIKSIRKNLDAKYPLDHFESKTYERLPSIRAKNKSKSSIRDQNVSWLDKEEMKEGFNSETNNTIASIDNLLESNFPDEARLP